ncbi:MAG: tetratricopeptide repeat protein [Nitrospirota bacterium]
MTDDEWVFNADEATFEERVIARSHTVPVVVDFWAEWCGPCRYLGPVLEDAVEDFQGKVVMAKVDTDRNLNLAQRYRIQTIPNVKAFFKGKVVNEFVGALPEPAIKAFLQRLIPTKADELVDQGATFEREQRWDDALAAYRDALGQDPKHAGAGLGELRMLVLLARWDEARTAYDRLPGQVQVQDEVTALKARMDMAAVNAGAPSIADLEAAVNENPGDLDTRFELAAQYAAAQRYRDALDAYVAILGKDRHFKDDAARKLMLQIFEVIGMRSPLAEEYREKLARLIY